MPPVAFTGVWAKVDRAKKHVAQLQTIGPLFADANKKLILVRENKENGSRETYMAGDPVMPLDYALLAGDVLQCLRSALDHLAYALCASGAGGRAAIIEDVVKVLQFPITRGDAAAYKALVARREIVRLAKPGVEQVLDAAEPYTRGVGDWLVRLSLLNNIDKHRLLVATGLYMPSLDVGNIGLEGLRKLLPERMKGFPVGSMPVFITPAKQAAVLKSGDVLYSEPLDRGPTNVNLKFPIAINEPDVVPVQPMRELITEMLDRVSDLIPKFDPFA